MFFGGDLGVGGGGGICTAAFTFGFDQERAQRFLLAASWRLRQNIRLLLAQEGLRPFSPLRFATRLTSHRGSPSSLRSSSHPRFAVPLTRPQPHQRPSHWARLNRFAETAIQFSCFTEGLMQALPRLAKPDRVPLPTPLRV